MVIGICIGETSLSEVTFISEIMPKVGEYVTMEYDGKKVLGMIENLVRGNDALNVDINDFKAIQKISRIGADDNYIRGKVKILGDINDNLKLPRTPVLPGTEIHLADEEILAEIFDVANPIKLGTLVNQSGVEVNVEANPILSRHLAILAMTGAGKSNTVSVLIDQLLGYNVPVFVFDMHGEYKGAEFPNGDVNVIRPKINPTYMSFYEDSDSGAGLININTAGPEELQLIPGVGPAIAGRIIEYREDHGQFQSIEEIKNVKGIGDKTFEKIKDHICC